MQHLPEFLKSGYKLSAEAVECKFPMTDGSRRLIPGTVGISDGFLKVLAMYAIVLLCHQLDAWLTLAAVWATASGTVPGGLESAGLGQHVTILPMDPMRLHTLRGAIWSLPPCPSFLGPLA